MPSHYTTWLNIAHDAQVWYRDAVARAPAARDAVIEAAIDKADRVRRRAYDQIDREWQLSPLGDDHETKRSELLEEIAAANHQRAVAVVEWMRRDRAPEWDDLRSRWTARGVGHFEHVVAEHLA